MTRPALAAVATAGAHLGNDAHQTLDRTELMAAWKQACQLPVPDYPAAALARLNLAEDPWKGC